jgi:hypothetical protein
MIEQDVYKNVLMESWMSIAYVIIVYMCFLNKGTVP